MSEAPPAVVETNLKMIAANGTLAIVDLTITRWRFTFRRCLWRNEGGRERIALPCDCGQFLNHGEARRFQELALAAVRELAAQQLHRS